MTAEADAGSLQVGSYDGGSIAVHSRGRVGAPVIVFVHGFGGTHHDWDGVIDAMGRDDYHFVSYDQRGHGETVAGDAGYRHDALAADLGSIVQWSGDPLPTVVGHSMGSMVVLSWLAVGGPASSALLTAAVANAPRRGPKRLTAAFMASGVATRILGSAAGLKLIANLTGPGTSPSVVAGIRASFLACHDRKAVDRGLAGVDLRDTLGSIALPVLVVAGVHDRATKPDEQKAVADALAAGSFRTIEHAGHFTPVEAPTELADRIRSFLAENASRSGA